MPEGRPASRPEDLRELAAEKIEVSLRLAVQVRGSAIWVAVFRLDGSPHAGGSQLWSRRYERPEGKTREECVEASIRALMGAVERGDVVLR